MSGRVPPVLNTKPILLLLLCQLLVLQGACATEEPGINPDRDQFYFPTSLALDRTRPYLYITNSNADLMYNGSTLTALNVKEIPANLTRMDAQIKAKKLDCVVGTMDPTVWECKESQFIQSTATLRMGDFPSTMKLSSDGKRLFVAMRSQSYLLWADVVNLTDVSPKVCTSHADCPVETFCNMGMDGEPEKSGKCRRIDLRCDNSSDSGCGGAGGNDCRAWDCDDEHKVSFSEDLQSNLPSNPFGLLLNELEAVHVDASGKRRTCLDGLTPKVPCDCKTKPLKECHEAPSLDHIYVTHLSGGEVSFFTVEPTRVRLRDVRGGFFYPSGTIYGGYGLAALTPGDNQTHVYISSRVDNNLASFAIKDDLKVVNLGRSPIGGVYPGTDARGIAYHSATKRLYMLNREPPTLVAQDMAEGKDGTPKEDALWAAEVCSEPSLLELGQDPTRPGNPSAVLAYVVCFGSNQIFVVDTFMGTVVDQIPTGKGPHSLVLDNANKRAFIANFLDNTVGVIDLDPSHASFNRMVLRIGRVTDLVKN